MVEMKIFQLCSKKTQNVHTKKSRNTVLKISNFVNFVKFHIIRKPTKHLRSIRHPFLVHSLIFNINA